MIIGIYEKVPGVGQWVSSGSSKDGPRRRTVEVCPVKEITKDMNDVRHRTMLRKSRSQTSPSTRRK